jgi:hypothetical protein
VEIVEIVERTPAPATVNGAPGTIRVMPAAYVPTPTSEYRNARTERAIEIGQPAPQPLMRAVPAPVLPGTRVLIWKQDPSVPEIGIRKAYLPGHVFTGPRDARIAVEGLPPVTANAAGDFIANPADVDAFDAVHTFAVVRETLTMYQRNRGGAPLPWQWNTGGNTDPISVFPHAGVTMNAFYNRNLKALKFFSFTKPGDPPTAPQIFTCRSMDIVSHETGHAVLDGLKPGWLSLSGPPQTGALHEAFGDISAIFLTLSQLDQVEAVIAQTRANLHAKNFLSDLAEQFGAVLGRPNGLRNADNDLKLSEVGTEVHSLSQVFTGGVYDVLADIFAHEQRPNLRDDAAVLYDVGQYMAGVVVRAIIAAPAAAATFADVVNRMRQIVVADGKPQYRPFITNQFALREVVPPGSLDVDGDLAAHIVDEPDAVQDRRRCCGTMRMEQDGEDERALAEWVDELAVAFAGDDPAAGNGAADKDSTRRHPAKSARK